MAGGTVVAAALVAGGGLVVVVGMVVSGGAGSVPVVVVAAATFGSADVVVVVAAAVGAVVSGGTGDGTADGAGAVSALVGEGDAPQAARAGIRQAAPKRRHRKLPGTDGWERPGASVGRFL